MPPLKTLYIHESNFDPEFTYFLPCRVLSMSHYIIGSGCGLAMQYYDTYDIIFLLSGLFGYLCTQQQNQGFIRAGIDHADQYGKG